jgi:hypothetical protein
LRGELKETPCAEREKKTKVLCGRADENPNTHTTTTGNDWGIRNNKETPKFVCLMRNITSDFAGQIWLSGLLTSLKIGFEFDLFGI